jgi:hypothetical protein
VSEIELLRQLLGEVQKIRKDVDYLKNLLEDMKQRLADMETSANVRDEDNF